MTDNAPPVALKDRLQHIHALIGAGRLADAADALQQLPKVKPQNDQDRERLCNAILTLGVFGFGDMAQAARVNASLPLRYRPDLRYRLALRQNDWRLAKKLRSQEGLAEDVVADFYWSASHRMLWSNRRLCGLRLYDNRVQARNFTKMLPSWLVHQPFKPDQPEQPGVLLEQGIGDALVHLSHFQTMRRRDDHIFFGLPHFRDIVARLAPKARFVNIADAGNAQQWRGTHVHCMGDYMIAHYERHRRLTIVTPLFPRLGKRPGRPLFGLSWRGGSGQNRRDERTIPLWMLLDLVPEQGAYVVLQHDLTEEEEDLIARHPNVMRPHMVLKGAGAGLLDLVSELAGVISVDNTNLHVAGAVGTPIFALMNPRLHWYFMPDGAVSNLYPGAETRPIGQARSGEIAAFMERAAQAPSAPALRRSQGPAPVLVTAPPRSRTSMVMGALNAGGLWTGQTVAATKDNPRGFFENRAIRETVIKPGLHFGGFDRLGVRRLPPRSYDAPWPGLAQEVEAVLRAEGWDGRQIWGFKDPKLLLVWRQWAQAFPDALWVLPQRDDEEIMASCLRTGFMRQHSRQPTFWRNFIAAYRMREAALMAQIPNALAVDGAAWSRGEIGETAQARLAAHGLDVAAMRRFVQEGLP